jgi:acetyl-CoA carboxylase biotin carboxyl carrier protein
MTREQRSGATLQRPMIDLRYVKKLIEIIDDSTVDSIEITSDKGMKIRISKSPQQRGAVQMAAPLAMPALAPVPHVPRLSPAQGIPAVSDADGGAAAEPAKTSLLDVKSPMVGTFYKSPEPGAKAYVSVGDRVSKGQIVCIIEAMKIMNEIESEYAGVVREILAQDSQPVEYGQVLFKIDPHG